MAFQIVEPLVSSGSLFTAFVRGRKSHVSLLHLFFFFQSLRPFWINETYMVCVLTLRQKQRLKRITNLSDRVPTVPWLFNLHGGHGSLWEYYDERCDRSSPRVEFLSLRRRTLGSVLRFIGSICTSSTLSWDSFLHSQLGDQGPSTLCATPSLTSVDSTSRVWSRLGAAARLRENPEHKYPPLVVRRNVRERSAPGRGTEAGAGGGRVW